MRFHRLLAIATVIGISTLVAIGGEESNSAKLSDPYLTVRMVDEDGKPVAGADVGFNYFWNHRLAQDWKFTPHFKSDADGFAKFSEGAERASRCGIYARHTKRRLVAIHDSAKVEPGKTLTVTMRPDCHDNQQAINRDTAYYRNDKNATGDGATSCTGFLPPKSGRSRR